ncbi:MAG: hypothetical protein ACSHWW_05975 [Nonlabens sp.]|uniref:hypothetical protein n=1 Tax=Nonlabens sp. TaxID=1888209 RepID=UPI003EF1DBF5
MMEYRKWLTFLFFLIAAALLWFVFKYNQTYSQHIPVEVEWSNIPARIQVKESQDIHIDVELTGNGFKLLNATFFSPSVVLDFQDYVTQENGRYYFIPSIATGSIKEYLSNDFKVDYVTTSKMEIQVVEFSAKQVPLIADFEIKYEENLQSISTPYFNPDSVLITGNDKLISEVKELKIKIPTVNIIDTVTVKQINLSTIFTEFKTAPQTIDYVVNAAVMTEGNFQIPVNVLNVPSNVTLKIIPSEVDVVFNCQLKDYDKISAADFKVEIDYLELENDFNTVVPQVIYKEGIISAVRHAPKQIQLLSIQ